MGILMLVGLSGCSSVSPSPLTQQEIIESSNEMARFSASGVPPLSHPLTLEEAMARALKYNLNERSRRLEQAIALNLWKAGNTDLLPKILASAGYRMRDSDLITNSKDSITGKPSLAHPFISSERTYMLSDLGLSWSVLDFTVGYFNAKQNADRVLIAAEHRRKAMHLLCRDVAIAFWRMVSAQKLMGEVRTAVTNAEAALVDASKAHAEGLKAPIDGLRYQRQMLENIRLLSTIEKDFSTARVTLASLINLPIATDFTVVEPAYGPSIAVLDVPVERMEELAIQQNAELREQMYNQRIAATEVRKTLARLMPNLSFNYDLKYNTDNYLINNRWNEAALAISQNLTNLIAAPAQKRLADGGVALAAQRRMALQMAILTQVHVARLEFASSYRQYKMAERIWELDQLIRKYMENKAEAKTESALTKIASDLSSIVSMLRLYQSLAEFNVSASTLQSTLGLEVSIENVDTYSVEDLSRAIAEWQNAWRTGRIPGVDNVPVRRWSPVRPQSS